MQIETFKMERQQCLYENTVEYDLSGSGVLPLAAEALLDDEAQKARFLAQTLGYPYSNGSPQLRERIALFYPGSRVENVTVTNGGSEANYLTLWTLLEKGERLACLLPNYMQAWGLGHTYAEEVDAFHLVFSGVPDRRRWALDVDELKHAVTPRTGVILVTNPNNPTGAVLSEAEMEAVVEAARKVKAWLVVDEIYRGTELDGVTTPTFWGRYEKVVITSGLSKAWAMPGLRLGWVVAPPKVIERVWIHHDYLTLTPNVLSNYLATLALEPARRDALLVRTRSLLQKNWPPLAEWLNARADLFTYAPPLAGASTYLQYKLPIKATTLADRLRTEASVLLMPGDYFGLSKGLRCGFGHDLEKTLRGLALTETFMRQLKHKGPAAAKEERHS